MKIKTVGKVNTNATDSSKRKGLESRMRMAKVMRLAGRDYEAGEIVGSLATREELNAKVKALEIENKQLQGKASGGFEESKYQGWPNRETWAVKLHWDNNEGDYNHFTSEAHNFRKSGKSVYEFADYLKEQYEEIEGTVLHPESGESSSEEARNMVSDVGSAWRVNWNEVAQHYYDDDKEHEEYNKKHKG